MAGDDSEEDFGSSSECNSGALSFSRPIATNNCSSPLDQRSACESGSDVPLISPRRGRKMNSASSSNPQRSREDTCSDGGVSIHDTDVRSAQGSRASSDHVTPTHSRTASELEIIRLGKWAAYCVDQLVHALHNDVDGSHMAQLKFDPLSSFNKRMRFTSLPQLTSALRAGQGSVSGASSTGTQPFARRQFSSRSGSVLSTANTPAPISRPNSVAPLLRAQPLTKASAEAAICLLTFLASEVLEEAQWLAMHPRTLSSDESKMHYLELCERLVLDCSALVSQTLDTSTSITLSGATTGSSCVTTLTSLLATAAKVLVVDSVSKFDWNLNKKTYLQWLVKLIGRGDVSMLEALLSCDTLMDALAVKDAKFLISCCVSSIDLDASDPVGCLAALMRYAPCSVNILREKESLATVWQEAFAHVVRSHVSSKTNRMILMELVANSAIPSISMETPGRSIDSFSFNSDPQHRKSKVDATPQDANFSSRRSILLSGSSFSPRDKRLVTIDFWNHEANDHQTILSRACREGDEELVNKMIVCRAQYDIKDFCRVQSDGTNALQQATARGHVKIVEALCNLPSELIAPAFEHVVKGRGTVFDIARGSSSSQSQSILSLLLNRNSSHSLSVKSSLNALTASSDSAAQELFPSNCENALSGDGDTLASISVVDAELRTVTDQGAEDVALEQSSPLSKITAAPSAHLTARECYVIAYLALDQLLHAHSDVTTCVNSITHDEAASLAKWFSAATQRCRSASKDDISEMQAVQEHLFALVRSSIRLYLCLRWPLKGPPADRRARTHEITYSSHVSLADLRFDASVMEPVEVVAFQLCARFAELDGAAPDNISNVATAELFGYSKGSSPLPSRVKRLLDAVAPSPLFSDTRGVLASIPLQLLAAVDDWLVAGLTVDGMFDTVMQCCSPIAPLHPLLLDVMGNRSLDLSEGSPLVVRVVTAMVYFCGKPMDHGLRNPAERCAGAVTRALHRHRTKAACQESIVALRAILQTITGAFPQGSTGSNPRPPARWAASSIASRTMALRFLKLLWAHRDALFFSHAAVAEQVEHLMHSPLPQENNPVFNASYSFSDTPSPFSSVQNSPDRCGAARDATESLAFSDERLRLPLCTLTWVATRIVHDVDSMQFLVDGGRSDAVSWVLQRLWKGLVLASKLVGTSGSHATDNTQAIGYGRYVTPDEKIVCFDSANCNFFASPPADTLSFQRGFLCPLFHRATLVGDTPLMKCIDTSVWGTAAAKQLYLFEGGCALNALLMSILIGARSAVEFVISGLMKCAEDAQLLSHPSSGISFHTAAPLPTSQDAAPSPPLVRFVDALLISIFVGDHETAELLSTAAKYFPHLSVHLPPSAAAMSPSYLLSATF